MGPNREPIDISRASQGGFNELIAYKLDQQQKQIEGLQSLAMKLGLALMGTLAAALAALFITLATSHRQ